MTDNPFLCSLPNKQHEATTKDVTDWKRRDEQRRENITARKRLMAAARANSSAAARTRADGRCRAGERTDPREDVLLLQKKKA